MVEELLQCQWNASVPIVPIISRGHVPVPDRLSAKYRRRLSGTLQASMLLVVMSLDFTQGPERTPLR